VKKKTAGLIGGVVLILVIVAWAWPKSPNFKDIARKYDFFTVKRMDLSEKIDATGNVLALEKKDLYADYEGAVEKVNVKAGDYVKKGDILVSITSSALKQQWQEADFSLKQAELSLNQVTVELATEVALNKITTTNAILVESNYHKVDLYKQQVKQARERLDALKLKNDGYYVANNETLFIRAPFNGQVAWINVSQGDKITPLMVLATEMKPDTLGVEAQIDQNDISMVKTGQNALITGKDPGQSQNPGYVTEISVLGQTAQDVVSFPVRIKLAGNSRGLKPGMSVDVTVLADEHPQTLAIPAGSVTSKKGRDLVSVRRNDRIIPVAVELGLKHGKFWEIKSGLKTGDQVAVPKPPLLAKQPAITGGGQRTGMFGR
jgi:HlyD family secretion protein